MTAVWHPHTKQMFSDFSLRVPSNFPGGRFVYDTLESQLPVSSFVGPEGMTCFPKKKGVQGKTSRISKESKMSWDVKGNTMIINLDKPWALKFYM